MHKTQYYIKIKIIIHIDFVIKLGRFITSPQTAKHRDNINVKINIVKIYDLDQDHQIKIQYKILEIKKKYRLLSFSYVKH